MPRVIPRRQRPLAVIRTREKLQGTNKAAEELSCPLHRREGRSLSPFVAVSCKNSCSGQGQVRQAVDIQRCLDMLICLAVLDHLLQGVQQSQACQSDQAAPFTESFRASCAREVSDPKSARMRACAYCRGYSARAQDFTNGNGTGGEPAASDHPGFCSFNFMRSTPLRSIYGEKFEDEWTNGYIT